MLRGKRSFASMRCIIDTVQATTRPGSTLRLSREGSLVERPSKTARGVARSAPEFEPQLGDIVALEHWCSSGFANTDLDLQLKKHGVHKLIVIGLIATTCVEATVRFAAELGYEVTMVEVGCVFRIRTDKRPSRPLFVTGRLGVGITT